MELEELNALPELQKWDTTILPTGETVLQMHIPKFIARQPLASDLMGFIYNSKCWRVIYNVEGGPFKSPW